MKNRYLKSLTARVTILMLSFLCLAGSQGAGAQIPMERRNSSSTSVVSSQKPVMPRMTKSGGNAVSVNGTEYDTWANAVAAINSNATETSFDIVLLNHVMDAKIMPSKACTISGSTSLINFAYINEDSYLTRLQMLAPLTFKNITLQVWQIAANGHALTFDEGVTVVSKYTSGEMILPVFGISGEEQIHRVMWQVPILRSKVASSAGYVAVAVLPEQSLELLK